MVKGTNPTIYMTKYLKEKSSFYFTLYHKLGHVKTDYNKAKSKIIVDDEETEEKADIFALNAMIDEKIWTSIINDPVNQEKICLENNISLLFLYTRLAYQGYINYNSKEYQSHRERIY